MNFGPPLTNIRGYLEALKDGVVPPSRETLVMLNQEALRLGRLVDDVLDLAKADAAQGQLHLATVDLRACLDGILATFRRAFAEKTLTLSLDAPEQPVMLQADRPRITRVLRNMVDNAVRYTPHGGRIDIHIRQNSADITMDFINPAKGLAPEDLPYLFERFYRGEKSRSREHGGAGIGLAMVKELVAAHGGSVRADIVDDRVRFRLTLPTGSETRLS
jgi:signal transduction histidine kinase